MKKFLFLITILALTIFSTACINNLAVQELNNKAADFMKKGDYESAISRLKASLDLDDTIFETHYNLGVACTENQDYSDAIEAFEDALKINPNSTDVYYSMAVMYENYAKDLFSGNTKEQKEAKDELADDEDDDNKKVETTDETGKYVPSDEEMEDVLKYYNSAIEAYNKYLELAPNSEYASNVQSKIQQIQDMMLTLNKDTN